ncbi:hypothetical protein Rs2_41294 [Raphanus sativus]|nr:hypothetical protein Rs2_41294 [Raphanus sativus]
MKPLFTKNSSISLNLLDIPANHVRRILSVACEEPVGLRVTPYHKPGGLRHILDTLEAHEIDVMKSSHFCKFLELMDQTPFSGRLGRYMLSSQLKVRKKYEAWFLYAENPIRLVERVHHCNWYAVL